MPNLMLSEMGRLFFLGGSCLFLYIGGLIKSKIENNNKAMKINLWIFFTLFPLLFCFSLPKTGRKSNFRHLSGFCIGSPLPFCPVKLYTQAKTQIRVPEAKSGGPSSAALRFIFGAFPGRRFLDRRGLCFRRVWGPYRAADPWRGRRDLSPYRVLAPRRALFPCGKDR